MLVKCKVCRRDIEVNESDYNPGDVISIECERCGNEIDVVIPERSDNLEAKKQKVVKVAELKDIQNSSESGDKDDSNRPQAKATEELSNGIDSDSNEEIGKNDESSSLESFPPIPPDVEFVHPEKKSGKWIVVLLLFLLICGAGGWWYYDNIYLPDKIDREAPRTYPIVNINLRSSKMSGSDYNKLTSVPYGGELITYSMDGEWADVKYVKPDGSESTKGYAAAPYLVDKKDFYLLNSIFGDNESREILATSKVRRALLDYYKQNGYVGKIASDLMNEVGLSATADTQWQVFFPRGDQKPNEVVFKRLMNPDSKFTDMALIIKNINSGSRKLLYFYFDDDETPHFLGEMEAPREGTLKDVVNNNGDITPIFIQ